MKWKTLTFFALITCLLYFLTLNLAQGTTATTDPFDIVFGNGSSFNMVNDWDRNLKIEVASGTLNGTNATMTIYYDSGQLLFYSLDDAIITLSCESNAENLLLGVSGATAFSHDADFIYSATLPSSTLINIQWNWNLESWIDKYSMLAIGLFSVCLLIFAPLYVAWGIRQEGFNTETFHRIMWAMLMFIIGIGLLLTWLWR